MMKKAMDWTVNLRTTPTYDIGMRVISMPNPDSKESHTPPTEWFEAAKPGWQGMTAHIGGLHLAQLRITERIARDAGDTAYANQCAKWIKAGADAMEKHLWTVGPMGGYYLNYFDPDSGAKSDWVFGYQLDGEWVTDHHGLPSALPDDRVKAVLETSRSATSRSLNMGPSIMLAQTASPETLHRRALGTTVSTPISHQRPLCLR